MKVKSNKCIIFSLLLVILLVVAVLSLIQNSSFDKKSVVETDIIDIPISTDKIFYIRIGETKTFDHVFWVHGNRWVREGLDWEVYEISFDPGVIVSCNPNSGIIYPGDPPTSISITITVIGNADVYKGKIEVHRISDSYDKEEVNILIVVL